MDTENFIKEKQEEIKARANSSKVISAISGGVDSVTCTVLAHRVIPEQLKVVFIDDGLMREKEPETVADRMKGQGIQVEIVNAQEEFFSALRGKDDPEEKRKAFRDTFYRVFGRIVRESGADFLLQGTIAADILETKGGIKTQHNVLEQIGLSPDEYGLQILEPLKELYKPDVREVAKALGLPEEFSQRMPFPGPGLAARVVGEVTPERTEIVRKATTIVEDEIVEEFRPFQAFAVLLNDRATGMRDGKREFGNIIVVRSVESTDAITAEVTEIPFSKLKRIQERITLEIPSVTKVLFDITPKPPSTIEYV